MKMNSDANAGSVLSEDLTEKNFGILANDKMFSILSSKIYSDKIAAPIRELSCNAYDAHVSVGKRKVPFNVHIPTEDETFFAVEDFGPGMDAYEIEELYTTYGYSSKTTSNKFVGCLGLGSKSPFAYTDSFRIISRKKGKEYHYQCLIENGMPKLIKFDEKDTELPSGVRIEFNVNVNDIFTFRWKSTVIFRCFDIRPKTNIDLYIEDYPEFKYGISICSSRDTYTNSVWMGNVFYNYNMSSFSGIPEYENFYQKFKDTKTILQAEIGDIEIAASREAAEMSAKTMKFIAQKHMEFADKLLQEMKEKKSTFKSTFEYLFAYGHFLHEHQYLDREDFISEVNSFSIPVDSETEFVKICNRASNHSHDRFCSRVNNELKIEHYHFKNNEIKFVFVPEGRLVSSQGINDKVDNQKGLNVYLFNRESFKKTLESMNIPVFEKKDFAVEKSKQEVRKTLKDVEGLSALVLRGCYESDLNNYGLQFQPAEQHDLDTINEVDTVYYVKTKFRSISFEESMKLRNIGFCTGVFKEVIQYIRSLNKEINICFIGVNADRVKKITNDSKYVNLVEYIIQNFQKGSEEYNRIQTYENYCNLKQNMGISFLLKFKEEFLTEGMKEVLAVTKLGLNYELSSKEQVFKKIYGFYGDVSRLTSSFRDFIVERYPMTRFLYANNNISRLSGDKEVEIIQNYINDIDAKELAESENI